MAATKSNAHMEKCHFCKGEMDPLVIPSICSYCRGMFCNQHKLPKSHGCSYKYQKKTAAATPVSPAPVQRYTPARHAPATAATPSPAQAAEPMKAAPKQQEQSGQGQEQKQPQLKSEEKKGMDADADIIKGVEGVGKWTLFKRRLFGGR